MGRHGSAFLRKSQSDCTGGTSAPLANAELNACQRKGNQGAAGPPRRLLELLQQPGFQAIRIHWHFAAGDLLFRSPLITKLANAEPLLRAHRRPKDAAGHRTGTIQITQPSEGVEYGTGLVIGKIFKTLSSLFGGIEQASHRVAGEAPSKALNRSLHPLTNGVGSFRVADSKLLQPLLKPRGIELVDGEDPHAALGSPGLAY